ncbi:MAG: hypothetical protein ACKPKO_60160, partial [Candidatus Fonsibacter sp.]
MGGSVAANQVNAYDPEHELYRPMTLVCVAPHMQEATARMAAQSREFYVVGALARLFGLTHIRRTFHRIPERDMQADQLHGAAAQLTLRHAGRANTFALAA